MHRAVGFDEQVVGVIEFEKVSKTFRDGTTAVSDLSLVVPSGKITVIVGPSGCGKTTTLRMVNRMLEPTKGRIVWDGQPLRSKRKTTLRRQMGYVIQSGGLFPHRTVLENIGTVPGLLHWDKAKIRKRSLELLRSVGLDNKLAHRYPAQLSGGQQQRVGVARALAADPLVMLMDEPFSAVDPVVRGELHEFFLGLQRQLSKTIILITHDIDEAIKLGDQVAILRVGGRLAQVGTPQQLLDEPADAFVEGFVGRDRGYRSLSFMPGSELPLTTVKLVRDPQDASGDNSLVVDAEARPTGWIDRTRPGRVLPLGSTFDPETDTLRAALDAALTSPVGLAVAVSRTSGGRFAGVVAARQILAQVVKARIEPEAVRFEERGTASSGTDVESEAAQVESAQEQEVAESDVSAQQAGTGEFATQEVVAQEGVASPPAGSVGDDGDVNPPPASRETGVEAEDTRVEAGEPQAGAEPMRAEREEGAPRAETGDARAGTGERWAETGEARAEAAERRVEAGESVARNEAAEDTVAIAEPGSAVRRESDPPVRARRAHEGQDQTDTRNGDWSEAGIR